MTLRLSFLSRAALVPASVALAASAAGAQGFGLNEIGTCAVSRGFAVTGSPCLDASVIYWNPAAATLLNSTKNTITGGFAVIALSGGFRADTTNIRYKGDIKPALVPHFFANRMVGRLAMGLGVYVPYGLTSQWKEDFPGRFTALKASLQTIYIQPNVAFAVTPTLSIGGGPVIGHSSVELIQSQDFSRQNVPGRTPPITFGQLGIPQGTEFARAHVTGDAFAAGFHVGMYGKLLPTLTVGVRYLSTLRFNYDEADARFEQRLTGVVLPPGNPITPGAAVLLDTLVAPQFTGAGALTSQGASTMIKHPWQAQVGIGYTGFARTTVLMDVARIGWKQFKELPFTFEGNAAAQSRVLIEDYRDVWSYRLGLEHMVAGYGFLNGVTVRGGYSYAETPAPDATVTPLLPDMARNNFSFGFAIPVTASTKIDASYLFVGTQGRRGRTGERATRAETASQLNNGAYDLKANVLSFTLSTSF